MARDDYHVIVYQIFSYLYKQLKIGTTLSNGIKISGQSKHFIERVIGTKEDPKTKRSRNGVEIEDIKEALIKI